MNEVDAIKDKKVIEKLKKYFHKESRRNEVLFTLGINVGLRVSDLRQLKVSDVLEDKVDIKEQKVNKRGLTEKEIMWSIILGALDESKLTQEQLEFINEFRNKQQKSKKTKIRTIHINESARKILDDYIAEFNLQPDDYLFTSERSKTNDKPIDRGTVDVLLKKAWKAIGQEGTLSSHSLRKTFGYWLYIQSNKDLVLVMKTLGHSSPEITSRYIGITKNEIKNGYLKLCL